MLDSVFSSLHPLKRVGEQMSARGEEILHLSSQSSPFWHVRRAKGSLRRKDALHDISPQVHSMAYIIELYALAVTAEAPSGPVSKACNRLRAHPRSWATRSGNNA